MADICDSMNKQTEDKNKQSTDDIAIHDSRILIRIIKFDILMLSCFASHFDAVASICAMHQSEINKTRLMQLNSLCAHTAHTKPTHCNIQLVYKYQNENHVA